MVSKHYDLDTDVTLGGEQSSDIHIASQKATKTYVDENLKDYAKKDEIPSIAGGVTEEELTTRLEDYIRKDALPEDIVTETSLATTLEDYVPTTRQINEHPLTEDVTLSTADFVLTGYEAGSAAEDLTSTDTLNQALSKLQAMVKNNSFKNVTVGMLAGEDTNALKDLWAELPNAEKLTRELLTEDINLVSTTEEGDALWTDEKYILTSTVDTYNLAVKTAIDKAYDVRATNEELTQALTDLKQAEEEFRSAVEAVNYGKKPIYKYEFTMEPDNVYPDQVIQYAKGSVNENYEPVKMTYNSSTHIGEFSYGDWENAFFMPRPVALNFDGEVVYELDKNDFTKKTTPYMNEEDFTNFTQKCVGLKSTVEGKLTEGTYTLPEDIKTYDEYHDCMIITYEKDDAHPWNLICIASKNRFKKEMLDIQESLDAVDVYFRLQSAINNNIVATLRDVNRTNTDTMFANIKANAVNLKIDQYLTDLQAYLNANVLTNQTCTTTACYEYFDFVYIAVKGANIKEDYLPDNTGEQTEEPFASVENESSEELKTAVTDLYNLKHNTWKIKKSTGSLEKVTQYYNYPFAHGTISCVDGVMSGFSSVNWCTIHKHFSPTGNWEMKFKVNFTKLGVAQYLIGSNIDYQAISLSLNATNQLVLTAYKNNTNTVLFPITTGTDKLDTTTDVGEYWCTLKFDTVEGYSGELLSTTDEEKKITVAYASTDIITPGYEITFGIDCDGKNDYYTAPLNGEIDIKDGYIKYTNEEGEEEYYWQPIVEIPDEAYAQVNGRYYRIDNVPVNRKWIIENDTDFVDCVKTLDKGTDIINNYNKYVTLDSDISNTDFDGNFMIEFPVVWFKYEMQEDGKAHIFVCNRKDDEAYHCYTHYNMDGEFIDKFYVNAFIAWKDTTKKGTSALPQYRSVADQTFSYNTNVANEQLWLENINNAIHGRCRYAHLDFGMMEYIITLLLLMGKSTNTQKVYGYGRSNGWVAKPGETKTFPMFYGADNTNPLKVFGIEDLWGHCWKRVAGAVYTNADGLKYKMTETTMDGSTVCRFNTDGQGYKKLGVTFTGTSGRYITNWMINEDGIFPTAASPTTEDTVIPDYMYWADNGYMWWGGSYNTVAQNGALSWAVNNANTSGGYITPMFACKPNIVYGADYTKLESLIDECNQYATWELTRSSSNGSDVYRNEWWNTPANITTFTTAITTAEGFVNHSRNQEMVDEATETLNKARVLFLAQRQHGTKVIPTI